MKLIGCNVKDLIALEAFTTDDLLRDIDPRTQVKSQPCTSSQVAFDNKQFIATFRTVCIERSWVQTVVFADAAELQVKKGGNQPFQHYINSYLQIKAFIMVQKDNLTLEDIDNFQCLSEKLVSNFENEFAINSRFDNIKVAGPKLDKFKNLMKKWKNDIKNFYTKVRDYIKEKPTKKVPTEKPVAPTKEVSPVQVAPPKEMPQIQLPEHPEELLQPPLPPEQAPEELTEEEPEELPEETPEEPVEEPVAIYTFDQLKADYPDIVHGNVYAGCNCPAFAYFYAYIISQLDANLRSSYEGRFPIIRNPQLLGTVCKHLVSVFRTFLT